MSLNLGIIASSRSSAAPPAALLLDTYPGAAAAYSLRKLRSAYTGAAIRVRRSSDNAETDIGFVSNVLDTTTLLTFCGAGNGFVSIWYDQSGNANNATNIDLLQQMPVVNSGLLYFINSKVALSLLRPTTVAYLALPTGILNATTNLSLLTVINIDNTTGENSGLFGPSSSFNTGIEILNLSGFGNRTALRLNGTLRNANSGASFQLWDDNIQTLTEIYGNTISTSAYKNNTSVTLTNSTAMPSLNFTGIYTIDRYGGNTGASINGLIQEFIIYKSNQLSNRTGIQNNINSYYTIY